MKLQTLFTTLAFVSQAAAFSVPPAMPNAAESTTITTAVSSDPAKAVKNELTQGEKLFKTNCAFCHFGGGNIIDKDKDLSKKALEQYLSLDNSELEDFVKNQEPHSKLPFQLKGAQDYTAVTSYVLDQALNDKW